MKHGWNIITLPTGESRMSHEKYFNILQNTKYIHFKREKTKTLHKNNKEGTLECGNSMYVRRKRKALIKVTDKQGRETQTGLI